MADMKESQIWEYKKLLAEINEIEQMNFYLNYLKKMLNKNGENPPGGVLSSVLKEIMFRLSLPWPGYQIKKLI